MPLIPITPWPASTLALAETSALAVVGEAVLAKLAANPWYVLPADETLCGRGDRADTAWLVVVGGLAVLDTPRADDERMIVHVGRGELVGEMELLARGPRAATVRARRDTVLVEVPRAAFEELAVEYPTFALAVASRIAARLTELKQPNRTREALRRACTLVALAPIDPGVDLEGFTRALLDALRRTRGAREVTAREVAASLGGDALRAALGTTGSTAVSQWILAAEDAQDVVLLRADPDDSEWTRFCLRQADVVLAVARADVALPRNALADRLRERPRVIAGDRRELALLHPAGASHPRDTARWLDAFPVAAHHHVREGRAGDLARVARRLTQEGVALSLSGGAARGMAHLGVLRALVDRGVPVDHVSGTSMGALFGAFRAAEIPIDDTFRAAREFSKSWFLDPTLPVLSALSGDYLDRFLREHFGDRAVEDLWLPYFSVASRLDDASPVPLRRGPLASAVRCSAAVPGLYAPVLRDGAMIVDGLFTENLPALRARDEVQGHVLAVNVIPPVDTRAWARLFATTSAWRRAWSLLRPGAERRVPPMFELVMHSFFLPTVRDAREVAREVDCYVEPAVGHINFLESWALDECARLGEDATHRALDAWLARAPDVKRLLTPPRSPVP